MKKHEHFLIVLASVFLLLLRPSCAAESLTQDVTKEKIRAIIAESIARLEGLKILSLELNQTRQNLTLTDPNAIIAFNARAISYNEVLEDLKTKIRNLKALECDLGRAIKEEYIKLKTKREPLNVSNSAAVLAFNKEAFEYTQNINFVNEIRAANKTMPAVPLSIELAFAKEFPQGRPMGINDIVLNDGRILRNITIQSKTELSIMVRDEDGSNYTIRFDELSPSYLKSLGFDEKDILSGINKENALRKNRMSSATVGPIRVKGRVLQANNDGVMLEEFTMWDSDFENPISMTPKLIGADVIFIAGLMSVNGTLWEGSLYPAGTFHYVNARNEGRTVFRYATTYDKSIKLMEKN